MVLPLHRTKTNIYIGINLVILTIKLSEHNAATPLGQSCGHAVSGQLFPDHVPGQRVVNVLS